MVHLGEVATLQRVFYARENPVKACTADEQEADSERHGPNDHNR